jgi:hypothetical protein
MHVLGFTSGAVRAVTISLALAGLLHEAARAQLTSTERAALDDLAPAYAQRFELRRGWARGRPIQYFDFGPAAVSISPVFLFVTGFERGTGGGGGGADSVPRLVAGQRPIFTSLPGLEGYSAIWQVHYVVVSAAYRANAVSDARTALGMALRGEARLVIPGSYVNFPIVPGGSTLNGDPANRATLTGWFKGRAVEYFDFGRSPLAPAPIFAFIRGMQDDEPLFLREQANVVDVVPEPGVEYKDMWDVHFVSAPQGYVPDTIRDLATLQAEAAAGRLAIRRLGQIRNCPVVIVDGRPAARIPLIR